LIGMILDTVERGVRIVGLAAVLVALSAIFWGLAGGLRRPARRTKGPARRVYTAAYYIVASVLYFGACLLLWRPVPLTLSAQARALALVVGGVLFFPGVGLVLWGRLALGRMYNVSSGLGVQLYEEQRLVTDGPYAHVRHPMYLGLLLVALGGILIYRTWAFVFFLCNFPGVANRARLEDRALKEAFGDEWEEYRRRVLGWIPRLSRPREQEE
jgi:protein-S-isoprenylcysteine O-methyltransferase Ste14